MLDGPPSSLSNSFALDFIVARRSESILNIKRSLITTNRTLIDTNFDYSEETIYVYCNFLKDLPRCKKIFYKGAKDTIIKLPDHVREGPFARIMSMELVDDSYSLLDYHVRKRSA
jgi:chitinase